jgi:hypothetical protein
MGGLGTGDRTIAASSAAYTGPVTARVRDFDRQLAALWS